MRRCAVAMMDHLPTEHAEQVALIRWVAHAAPTQPELGWLFAIPNGGHRHRLVAAKLRAEGVRAGVPDLYLPVARGRWHGLFVEMKRRRGGQLSAEQKIWTQALVEQGYQVRVCAGWEAARDAILAYLREAL